MTSNNHCSRGPVFSLPGMLWDVEAGATCDSEGHENALAKVKIQGETDSFGCEFMYMCGECYEAFKNRDLTEERTGTCDLCKKHKTDLAPWRDVEEGMAGPVYSACDACVEKHRAVEDFGG